MSLDRGPGSDERARRNAELAYERVRNEALRYRQERDRARERLAALNEQLSRRTSRLTRAWARVEELQEQRRNLRERVKRLEDRLADLQASRGVRVEAATRRWRQRISRQSASDETPAPTTVDSAAPPAKTPSAPPYAEVTTFGAWMNLDPERVAQRTAAANAASKRFADLAAGQERLRVAAIVDDFTRIALEPECELLNLDAADWRAQIEEFDPHLLFVESAWRGHGGSWRDRIASVSEDLQGVFAWCRERAVASVFWNKEDPVHFERYLMVAAEADFVFTTDLDKVGDYRLRLGHDRANLLPFAAQPRLHNPLEIGERREAVAFAGAYYPEFKDRMRDLRELVTGAAKVMPVEIFDRYYGTTVESAQFPPEYSPYIVGTLGPEEIEVAYKGYRYGMNLNTVKTSRSMFARRVFELLASNTVVISNRSDAVSRLFADLVPMADTAGDVEDILRRLDAEPTVTDRLRALGVRKVLGEHTYTHRLAYVSAAVAGRDFRPPTQSVTVVVPGDVLEQVQQAVASARAQAGVEVALTIVTTNDDVARWCADEQIRAVAQPELADLTFADLAAPAAKAIAVWDIADWHGEHYLRDLVDGFTYSGADVVGKDARYRLDGDATVTEVPGASYVEVASLTCRRSVVMVGAAAQLSAVAALAGEPVPESLRQVAVHRFDYCEGGAADRDASQAVAGSGLPIDVGVGLDEYWTMSAAVSVDRSLEAAPIVLPQELAPEPASSDDRVHVSRARGWLAIRTLGDGVDENAEIEAGVAATSRLTAAAIWPEGIAYFGYYAEGDLQTTLTLSFYDDDREIETMVGGPGVMHHGPVPANARTVGVRWQVQGAGRSIVSPIHLSEWPFADSSNSLRDGNA